MRNDDTALTRQELDRLLARALKLEPTEKMGIYHGLIEILKTASDPREAANTILCEIDHLFQAKATAAHEKVENKVEAGLTVGGRISPIFRRVGR